MARINIEDSLFKDSRFVELSIKLGSRHAALGALIEAWIVAQKYFTKKEFDGLITEAKWAKHRLRNEIIEVGLAVKKEVGIYMAGAKKQFSWLIQASEAGKKSVQARRKKNGSAQPNPKKLRSSVERPPKVSEPLSSLLFSPFSELSSQNSNSVKKNVPSEQPAKSRSPEGANLLIAHYCDEWKKRYRAEKSPKITGYPAKVAKDLVKSMGLEEAKRMVTAYLAMPDHWFVTKSHDLPTLFTNLNKVGLFAEKGKFMTRGDINQLDKAVTVQNTIDSIRTEGV